MDARTVDLHVHLAPGVDDGPATWEEATALLERLRGEMPAASTLVATPHATLTARSGVLAARERRVQEFFSRLGTGAGGRELRILAGHEVMLDTGRMTPRRLDALCLPGTSWILVELPPRLPWFAARRRIARVARCGFRPLLAHPERYAWCRSRPERLLRLNGLGAAVQVSARSLAAGGPLGESARLLLETGLAHVLASDAHAAGDPSLSDALAAEVERIRPGTWSLLTAEMPGRILDNRDVPPLPLEAPPDGEAGP